MALSVRGVWLSVWGGVYVCIYISSVFPQTLSLSIWIASRPFCLIRGVLCMRKSSDMLNTLPWITISKTNDWANTRVKNQQCYAILHYKGSHMLTQWHSNTVTATRNNRFPGYLPETNTAHWHRGRGKGFFFLLSRSSTLKGSASLRAGAGDSACEEERRERQEGENKGESRRETEWVTQNSVGERAMIEKRATAQKID